MSEPTPEQVEADKCGIECPALHGETYICAFSAGHPGPHRQGHTTWMLADEQVEADLAQDEQAHARYYAQAGVPVANPERVAEVLNAHYYDVGWSKEHQGFRCVCGWLGEDHVQHVTDVLAAGVFRDEATVKAEALEAAALGWAGADEGDVVSAFLDARATALRAGEPS